MKTMTPAMPPPAAAALPANYEVKFPDNLPSEDNENMDSPWHRAQMELLIDILETNWKGQDFYCGGNMFIHFSMEHVRNKDFRGPDFFVVKNVNHDKPRQYWATWEEGGRYPDLIIELLSPTTAREDLTTKKVIYEETFKTGEYFCYDPSEEQLDGWRLEVEGYQAITAERDRKWSKQLKMWLGKWQGTRNGHEGIWLRFFDRDGNLLPTGAEMESARADVAAARAEAAATRVKAATARADAAEAEAERLRKELHALRLQQNKPNS
jgi:Uma2 family endonuclease